ncbi:phage holin family protein [Luteibacter sp. PPL201]|uniref:Phage holin family protein n=1 Tax=Luteibacter sahnii TaxID=3021977 RepID=A0ABT6B7R5_9GAMM
MNEIPPQQPFETVSFWVRIAAVAVFAAVGGLIGALLRAMDSSQPMSFTHALVEFFAAGFVGALSSLLCSAWGLSIVWTAFIAGTFGMLGARATVQVMQRFAWTKLGLNRSSQDDEPAK